DRDDARHSASGGDAPPAGACPVRPEPRSAPHRAGRRAGYPGREPATRPPSHRYPVSTNRFWKDLGRESDKPIARLDPGSSRVAKKLHGVRDVVMTGDAYLGSPLLLRALEAYVRRGGRLVLTDGALRALGAMGVVKPSAVAV